VLLEPNHQIPLRDLYQKRLSQLAHRARWYDQKTRDEVAATKTDGKD